MELILTLLVLYVIGAITDDGGEKNRRLTKKRK